MADVKKPKTVEPTKLEVAQIEINLPDNFVYLVPIKEGKEQEEGGFMTHSNMLKHYDPANFAVKKKGKERKSL